MTSFHYDVARSYWEHEGEDSDLFGVTAMGDGGLTEVFYRHFEEVRHLRSIVTFTKQSRVLELGSGNGRWIAALAPLVSHYDGVDFSRTMLDLARQRVDRIGLTNVTLSEGAAQAYTPAKRFDVIYLSGVSQYLHDADLSALLERLKSGLRPGGVVVDRSTVHRRARLVADGADYFSIYRTSDEIVALFEGAGLINGYRSQSYPFLVLPHWLRHRIGGGKFARLVRATAPVSFLGLRALAFVCSKLFKPTGDVLDYSHEFFVFQPTAPSLASV